jgi:hypothetical protein
MPTRRMRAWEGLVVVPLVRDMFVVGFGARWVLGVKEVSSPADDGAGVFFRERTGAPAPSDRY